jgi:hypothetical protein
MDEENRYRYVLIRDSMVIARVLDPVYAHEIFTEPAFFDVRTGVRLKEIHPPFHASELVKGYSLARELAETILAKGAPLGLEFVFDLSKVVSILEVKQRRLDSVVADSILDQVRRISDLLREFVAVAETADTEERFWMSQQVLSFVRKFSGRELEEIEEVVNWLRQGRKR